MLTTDKFPQYFFGFSQPHALRNFHRTFFSEFTRDKTTNEYSSSLSYMNATVLIALCQINCLTRTAKSKILNLSSSSEKWSGQSLQVPFINWHNTLMCQHKETLIFSPLDPCMPRIHAKRTENCFSFTSFSTYSRGAEKNNNTTTGACQNVPLWCGS